jgi:hypothetical protein
MEKWVLNKDGEDIEDVSTLDVIDEE